MKIVINRCYGGFVLSQEAEDMYKSLEGLHEDDRIYCWELYRADPNLIKVIEELGDKANGRHSKLKIVEIPDDVNWEIDEYDGMEVIHEVHRRWY